MRDVADSLGNDLDIYDDCLAGDGELLRINEDRTSGDALSLKSRRPFTLRTRVGESGSTVSKIAGESVQGNRPPPWIMKGDAVTSKYRQKLPHGPPDGTAGRAAVCLLTRAVRCAD
ncbi:MAG: hypothetical protein IPK83_05190 [Planctomycetes bacterium]|nr:hypothetical protein [Planctomycetota bacterium]